MNAPIPTLQRPCEDCPALVTAPVRFCAACAYRRKLASNRRNAAGERARNHRADDGRATRHR